MANEPTIAIPPDVYERLKVLARRERRSIRMQALHLIEQATAGIDAPVLQMPPTRASEPTPLKGSLEWDQQQRREWEALNRELDAIGTGADDDDVPPTPAKPAVIIPDLPTFEELARR